MKIETFVMERFQSTWENRVTWNVSESGVHPLRVEELAETDDDRAAVLAHRVTDTIKQVPPRAGAKLRRLKLKDLNRETLWAMETPQAFARELIVKAYEKVRAKKARVTDDIAAAALLGHPATLVENPCPNPKLTHPEDFAWAELLLGRLG